MHVDFSWLNEQLHLFLQCTLSIWAWLHEKYNCHTPVRRKVTATHNLPTSQKGKKSIARWLIRKINNNCYRYVKLKNQFQNWTQCTPLRLLAIAAWSPKGERPVIAEFIVVRWRSTGLPAFTAGTLDDRRLDTGRASIKNLSFPERIGRQPNSLLAAIVRQPLGDFTTLFKVKKIGRRATDLEK